jgi:hypothetical protein
MGQTCDSCNDFLMNSNSIPLGPHSTLCLEDSFRSHSVLYFSHFQGQYQDSCILLKKTEDAIYSGICM